jgi:DNA-binding transcriptional ArsR family regulator
MTVTGSPSDFLPLFKALADSTRLSIIGLLAQRPHAVEDLASALKKGASTVSHHLSVLAEAGLVSARVQGYYNVYSLHTEPLREMSRNLLRRDEPEPAARPESDAFDRKVLTTFLTPDGRIKAFPVQEKKYQVLVRHVLKEFQPGIRYPEKRVNQILARFNPDTARLRRSLVEYRYMAREGGGGKYWVLEKTS